MNKNKLIFVVLIVVFQTFALTGCQPSWQIPVADQTNLQDEILKEDVAFYLEIYPDQPTTVPLGQLFYHLGYIFVEEVTFHQTDGNSITYPWTEIAEEAQISGSGEVFLTDESFSPSEITLITVANRYKDSYSIMDIAPTVASALDLPNLPDSQGQSRLTEQGTWDRAVMIMLDGLQYDKLVQLITQGELPFLATMNQLQQGITVYPPITTSASAALLTSTPPIVNGVYGYGYRTTDTKTLFDLAVENGRRVTAVEGASLAFNLKNAETILSGDKDNDGFSDDNVLLNSLQVIETAMPDLLYIHFHDIDDLGHTYGPESQEYAAAISRVDTYLLQIYEALPSNTFIVLFADHGMHATANGGNHGTLTPIDLEIPIIFLEK